MGGLKTILTAIEGRGKAVRKYVKANQDDVMYVICMVLLSVVILRIIYQQLKVILGS
jgi:hypothetical protein